MPILNILLVVIVFGVALGLINRYVPMQRAIKNILNVIVVIVLLIWIFTIFTSQDQEVLNIIKDQTSIYGSAILGPLFLLRLRLE